MRTYVAVVEERVGNKFETRFYLRNLKVPCKSIKVPLVKVPCFKGTLVMHDSAVYVL